MTQINSFNDNSHCFQLFAHQDTQINLNKTMVKHVFKLAFPGFLHTYKILYVANCFSLFFSLEYFFRKPGIL